MEKTAVPGPLPQTESGVSAPFSASDLLLLLMTFIWGSNFTVIKLVLGDFQPFAFNALRFVIASAFMIAVALATRQTFNMAHGDRWQFLFLGLLSNVLYQMLFIMGVARTRAGNASLILATTPLFTAIIGRLRGQEYFTARGVTGLLLAFGGMALIIFAGNREVAFSDNLTGNLMMLGATICWTWYSVGARRLAQVYGSIKATTLIMLWGTPILLLISAPALARQEWSGVSAGGWVGVFASGLLAIGLAYIIWNYGVRKIGATRTAVYSNTTPIFALLVAWPVLGEAPTLGQVAGAVVILTGIYLVRNGLIHTIAPAEAAAQEMRRICLRPGKN
ncbi:MAG TPA: EamA family transporter [Blastocatellia bacterium]|nr:EamA family transporter [Blastocatellia bacterium]